MRFIDSHTGGEPTRVILDGFPEVTENWRVDLEPLRRATVCEPRGHDVLVGAFLFPHPEADWGIIFFNNVGWLGMCGHGTIGVVETLVYLGLLSAPEVSFWTPAGTVHAKRHDDGRVSVANVRSYVIAPDVQVGDAKGCIAYGGNTFLMVEVDAETISRPIPDLLIYTQELKQEAHRLGHLEVDHVELIGPARVPKNHSRNFVLCPGDAYDRSPCGTGTSARLAQLAASGRLKPGEEYRVESIIGSVFSGHYESADVGIMPTVTGRAFVVAEGRIVFHSDDAFDGGIV